MSNAFAVLCTTSSKNPPIVGLKDRVLTNSRGWWTSDAGELFHFFNEDAAHRKVEGLSFNNPRVVPIDEAIAILEAQASEELL